MADLVSPIVDIISRLWPCCAKHTRYLCKLQENKILLRNAMDELKEVRDDVQARVVEAEADLNEPKKKRTAEVSGWLQRVEKIEGEVEVILKKAGEQLSRARCLGVCCCPPNNCWSNYNLGKSIAKKIPLVVELKGKRDFQEVTHVARHTSYVCKLQDNKILLRNAMDELKNVTNDVQRKVVEAEEDQSEPKMRTDQVRGWLQSVENIEGEVEVILQTTDEQLSNAISCHEKDKLVVMKKASVDELKEKGHFQELTYRLPPSSVEDMNLESTVGMESMFDKVWRLIINSTVDDKPVSNIIGLYGTGGVGKTTLLEKINNEFHNKISTGEHGFVVIFVVVSKPVNYEEIQKKIGERLGLSLQGDGDEKSRAQKIFNSLRKKNYVLLLDDIWEDQSGDQFDKKRIGIPIQPQGNSKLIFTTRSERVCELMEARQHTFQVECLPWDKAWSLFQDKVGEKALNYLSGAHELAKDVAKECGGLPLALITIGRAMSTKKSVQEWRDARITLQRYAAKFKDMRDKVLPRLKLSYDNLSDETEKSCFRYCALFPEDHSIEINKLVELWIAEGFLDGIDNLGAARDRGHTIIGSLKSACLLESSGPSGEDVVKMHDVIRDLALWIVNDCSSSRSSDESGSSSSNSDNNKFLVAVNEYPCKKWENAERIFWDAIRFISSNEEKKPPTPLNLLTLIVMRAQAARMDVFRLPQSFFQHMPLLRVLDLSKACSSSDEFPISICELHELQYLNLSGTDIRELPIELRKLVKLKFLVLRDTNRLRRIPAGLIANLSELQVLDLGCYVFVAGGFEDWELEDGPSFSELDGLKQLQEVPIVISTDVALEKFLCNRKLQMVCTCLKFSRSYSSSSRRVLDLSNFESLKDLKISGFSELEELVLYGRITGGGLLTNLEKLSLDCFPKLNSILWMAAAQPDLLCSRFQSLHEIIILNCHALKDLTWVVYVQNLKTLSVHRCEGIETIIDLLGDDGLEGTGGGVFRRLKFLDIRNLPKLKSICRHALAFPSIVFIHVNGCPELKKLPLDSGSNVNHTLRKIFGETEWWNELQWESQIIKYKFFTYWISDVDEDSDEDVEVI